MAKDKEKDEDKDHKEAGAEKVTLTIVETKKTTKEIKPDHKSHGAGWFANVTAGKVILVFIAALVAWAALSKRQGSTNTRAGNTPPSSNDTVRAPSPNPWHKGLLVSPNSAPDPVINNRASTGVTTTAACAGKRRTVALRAGEWQDIDKHNACRVLYFVPPGKVIYAKDADGTVYQLTASFHPRAVTHVMSREVPDFSYTRCPKGTTGDCSSAQHANN